jgi:CDP-6-deoxy-D-xylo-4-hexulose-3-dehydrase
LLAVASLTSHLQKDKAIRPGDEIITCAAGFPTTVNPMLLYGITPVFVDAVMPTYNIDVEALEEAVTCRTKAIMIAHTLGNPFDLDAVTAVAKKHDLFIIEDACDAFGSTYRGKQVGTFGDIGTLSFYPAHHITTGEGGAVFTNKSIIRRALESIRDWGRDCYCPPGVDDSCGRRFDWTLGDLPPGFDHKYIYSHLGFNLKFTDMQAAIGVAQLDRLEEFTQIRRRNFSYLYAGLSKFEAFLVLPEATTNSDPSWFGFPITVKTESPFERNDIVRFLNRHRIGTRFLFGGNLTRQPYMKGRHFRTVGKLTNADLITENTFWIGVFPGLTVEHLQYVIDMFDRLFFSGVENAGKLE